MEILERFCILIIGNANAGKTTILSKICNGKIEKDLEPSTKRGEHNIEDEIVYPLAKAYVFHDSRGFEAGAADELDKVKAFIEARAKSDQLKDQLHAIWYCLPTSGDRLLTKAEMSFFEIGTGIVPVIAIFTKMDAIDSKVFNEMLKAGHSFSEAKKLIPSAARTKFDQEFLVPLKGVNHKPAQTVELRDMHKQETNCDELIFATARALNKGTLKLLVLSFYQNNLDCQIELAVRQ